MKYVVVGTGVAGLAAIEAIRSIDAAGEIAWIGDDAHGYYSRPGLAYLLTGEVHDRQLYPQVGDELKKWRVNRTHARVARLFPAQRSIELQQGDTLSYDRLLLALGAQAAPLDVPGAQLQGVFEDIAKRVFTRLSK